MHKMDIWPYENNNEEEFSAIPASNFTSFAAISEISEACKNKNAA